MKKAICHPATLRERYLRPEEQVTQAKAETAKAERWAAALADKLKDLGMDPNSLQ